MPSIRESYPQTHIQTIGPLLLLMHDKGFNAADLEHVGRVYHFALKLWAVNFQSSSRPFICHAVGTAGMVAEHGGDLDSIVAGLLHAAYSTGDFGVRIGGANKRKRQIVREIAGEIPEQLIYRFHQLMKQYDQHWEIFLEKQASEDRASNGNPDNDLKVLFMRVCNELDDISDLPFSSDRRRQRIEDFTSGSIQLAHYINRPDLAIALQDQHQIYKSIEFMPPSLSQHHSSGHIVLPPAFRKRLIPGIREVLHRWRTTGSPRVR